jgi:hypothetical protein
LTRDPKGELWSLAVLGKRGGCGCAGEPVGDGWQKVCRVAYLASYRMGYYDTKRHDMTRHDTARQDRTSLASVWRVV